MPTSEINSKNFIKFAEFQKIFYEKILRSFAHRSVY